MKCLNNERDYVTYLISVEKLALIKAVAYLSTLKQPRLLQTH